MVMGICDDEEMIEQIAAVFLEDGRDTFDHVCESIEAENIEEVATYAHKLKGAGANIGARCLYEIAIRLEDAARGVTSEDLPSIFAELESEFHRLMSFLKQPDWTQQAKALCRQSSQS